jgi:hypothetical protein
VKSFNETIPRNIYIDKIKTKVFYRGQISINKEQLCSNCFQHGHYKANCNEDTACVRCRKQGHKPGDEDCEASLAKANANITMFQAKNDILSNSMNVT